MQVAQLIANELQVRPQQVEATIKLLDEGATVPFIARYRKEVTGALDDGQLRQLSQRLGYLRELNDRKQTILGSIRDQGKLSDALEKQIQACDSKSTLEDLYLPYRPKRRTKAQKAREAGLEPLAQHLLKGSNDSPQNLAAPFVDASNGIETTEQALDGARHILIEQFAEQASLVGKLREWFWQQGVLRSKLVKGKEQEGAKFRDYFEYSEGIRKVPSHRALALMRGSNEGILRLQLALEDGDSQYPAEQIRRAHQLNPGHNSAGLWLSETINQCWKQKLQSSLENDLLKRLREQAEAEAIRVFGRNLHDLLLAAPAGPRATIGLDPGLRTGVKVAVVDSTGKLLEHCAIYPHAPKNQWDQALATLAKLAQKHNAELISIGNGTASRETEQLAKELISKHPALDLTAVMVNEAGASVYSASEQAAKEFPDLDVTIRGAVSIARRLQDPLAELVKIEPKAIGVGQYQHDVDQNQLGQQLDAVVEDCVNSVGVDINTASVELLSQVAGLNATTARNIVAYRDEQGRFNNRSQLKKVARLGPKAFEQCAGFLRIREGDNPLDNSAVHPEAYALVKQIASVLHCKQDALIGNTEQLGKLNPQQFISDQFGEYTVRDVLQELEKPGRDPRPEFRTAQFSEGVETLNDLEPGMKLEGVITNVTNFGAFVDIGVHQDGLVHISQLANRFVKDPHELVKAGDIVQVQVVEVDIARKRIGLSMKDASTPTAPKGKKPLKTTRDEKSTPQGSLADKFRAAGWKA
ncbi:Tex family protein [Pontibacterium granulatum]|uniref:Tex family protein n=1 Tax=Pontibacterium granulatum TaxID=2036029 RepID=UPI00249C00CD|nr:Tex family protein [Pontibacterium granulatum]MDI3325094.1 Tex family protein [Pontibacterium granulatum]